VVQEEVEDEIGR